MLEKTLESPLDSKEIQPVNSKRNQPWIFLEGTDAEAEALILWPPDEKSWLIWKDPDAGKDWRQGEKGMPEDEMVRWHHLLNGPEFEQTLGDSEGQESPVCCSLWGRRVGHDWATERQLGVQGTRISGREPQPPIYPSLHWRENQLEFNSAVGICQCSVSQAFCSLLCSWEKRFPAPLKWSWPPGVGGWEARKWLLKRAWVTWVRRGLEGASRPLSSVSLGGAELTCLSPSVGPASHPHPCLSPAQSRLGFCPSFAHTCVSSSRLPADPSPFILPASHSLRDSWPHEVESGGTVKVTISR